jgi:hypothetical protein
MAVGELVRPLFLGFVLTVSVLSIRPNHPKGRSLAMMKWRLIPVLFVVVSWCLAGGGMAQSPHVLNDFEAGQEGWDLGFGTVNNIHAENGKLFWETDGTSGAIRDSYNNTEAVFQPNAGGVDLTGLSSIEFVNLVYTGEDPTIDVEFYVQASVDSNYKGSAQLIGHDVTFTAGIPQSVTVPLSSLLDTEIAWVRVWGVNVRTHTSLATWSLDEVRSLGPALQERYIARFTPDSPDNGFQSMIVNWAFEAIQGNDGLQNQDGLSVVPAAGVDGALQFVSIGGAQSGGNGAGGAISLCNGAGNFGTSGSNYWTSPTDVSNYKYIEWLMKAQGEAGSSVQIQLFLQSGGWSYFNVAGGSPVTLEADGEWHKVTGELTGLNAMDNVQTIGINLYGHPTDLTIQIDHVRGHNDQPTSIGSWDLY